MNRRDFLKALGLTSGASVVSACGLDDNLYRSPIETVLPYVVRPEQVIPGNPTFFATTVLRGPQAFPVVARHRDGRVINVGANFQAPYAAAVPREAYFELQRHYSPDRFRAPLAAGQATSWEAGLQQLADAVSAARSGGKKVAYLGPLQSGSIVSLLREFTNDEAVFWEPLGPDAEVIAAERLFGQRVLPAYDLSKAHYVLGFGADFLGTWGNTAHQSQYAAARNPNEGHFVARFAHVSPHRGQTGANADDWLPARSGSEAHVALAVARLVAEQKGYQGPLSGALSGVTVESAAQASGLTAEQIQGLAQQFAAGPAVALPGGTVGATRNATELAMATYILNLVSGNGGVTFGMGPVYQAPVDGLERMERLIADMKAGNIAVLLLDDANPVYSLPASLEFAAAMANVPLVVGLSSHPNETNAAAKLILPVSDAFEDWGDEEPAAGLHLIRQPAQTPLYDTRSLGDVLLAVARSAGMQGAVGATPQQGQGAQPAPQGGQTAPGAPAGIPPIGAHPMAVGFAAPNWREYIKSRWQQQVLPGSGLTWEQALVQGYVDARPALQAPSATGEGVSLAPVAPEAGEYQLIAYPHAYRHDGRYANQPWAQELPDPMTGHVWDTWVEIHPDTAARLGVHDNSLVEIKTAVGAMRVGVELYRNIRPDTIAIAFGQGHEAAGRYANEVGANVAKILTIGRDTLGATVWQNNTATLTDSGESAVLVSTFGSDFDHDRSWGVVCDAEELAKVGDAAVEHPGELTGIHHLAMDKRLQAQNITDFYSLPDHPNYRFGMTIDVNACNGCNACAVACYAENNLPIVGKQKVREGREMAWLRVNRYLAEEDGSGATGDIRFVPMLCQHCGRAPCESVCPVLATYHTIDGLNAMVYNRCVGTRYCSNNCPWKVRRFNYHSYVWPEPFNLQLNPEVVTRTMGIMEKCTFCVQRIRSVKSAYRNNGFTTLVPEQELVQLTACAEACPTGAIQFGNLNNPESAPSRMRKSARTYETLAELNTSPAINYLAKASFHPPAAHHGPAGAHAEGGEHGGAHGDEHGAGHGEAAPAHNTPAEQPGEHH